MYFTFTSVLQAQGPMQDFLKGGPPTYQVSTQKDGGGGGPGEGGGAMLSVGPNVKKPTTSWAKTGGPDQRTPPPPSATEAYFSILEG